MDGEQKYMDTDNVKYLIDMSNSLAGINGKMTMLCNMIAAHETRIQHLEEKQAIIPAPAAPAAPAAPPSASQNSLLAMALKAILFASATAMALAGAGKFLSIQ